jgi:hypothetical protein
MIDPYSDALAGGDGFGRDADPGEPPGDLLSPSLVDAWSEQQERLRGLIRAHPVWVVCGALALGFVVARSVRDL